MFTVPWLLTRQLTHGCICMRLSGCAVPQPVLFSPPNHCEYHFSYYQDAPKSRSQIAFTARNTTLLQEDTGSRSRIKTTNVMGPCDGAAFGGFCCCAAVLPAKAWHGGRQATADPEPVETPGLILCWILALPQPNQRYLESSHAFHLCRHRGLPISSLLWILLLGRCPVPPAA